MMNSELLKTWKEAIVAYLEVLSQNSPGVTEENYEISQEIRTGFPRFTSLENYRCLNLLGETILGMSPKSSVFPSHIKKPKD
jgi:hypothetical protein